MSSKPDQTTTAPQEWVRVVTDENGPLEAWIESGDDNGSRGVFGRRDLTGKLCSVRRGINGEWYVVTLNEESWADPLQGLDNVRGTGSPSAAEAVAAWLRG